MTTKKTKTTKRSPERPDPKPIPIYEDPIVREAIVEFARLLTTVMKQLHKEFNEQLSATPTGASVVKPFIDQVAASTNGATKGVVATTAALAPKDEAKPDRRKKETTRVHAPPPTHIHPPSQPSAPDAPPELE